MKKAKRVLSLVIAAIMIFAIACPTALAKNDANIYETAGERPYDFLNGVDKYEFTADQGASYILDMLDNLLYGVNLAMVNEPVLDEWYATAKLTIYFRNIDEALWTLYNIVNGVVNKNETCIRNFLNVKVIGIGVTGILDTVLGMLDLGDITSLTVTALGDQNNAQTRLCRNIPAKESTTAGNDLAVLKMLTQFLSDNRGVLKKIATSNLDLGILGGIDLGDEVGPFLNDFPNALKNILYGVLINGDASEAPAGWTYDAGIQQIIDWLLIYGTGHEAGDGGKSVLGENFEAFLPGIGEYPHAASITDQNVYSLVNNAVNALLGGMVADLLEGLLVDLLKIDATANNGKGDTEIMSDVLFNTILGAIESLCTANGAPAIIYTDEENTYPIPKLHKLLDWFFNGGGLATFIKIDYNGIEIEDNLISLLNDVIRIVPGLFPLLGFEVPKGLTYTTDEMTDLYFDPSTGEPIYLTFEQEEIRLPDPENYPDDYVYVSSNASLGINAGDTVNTTDPGAANYRNPKFIRQEYILSNSKIYAALVKILLNNFIDGCYFPEWADSIASVGAYAIASVAVQYVPENNYFDRLDAYHAQQIGQSYSPLGASSVTPLAYTEEISVGTKTVTVPRAAMDIGASLLAYLLNGWNDFQSTLGFTPETDNNWETYLFEFIIWGASKFMPILTGKWNPSTKQFDALDSGADTILRTTVNTYVSQFYALRNRYPATGPTSAKVNNIPSSEMRSIIYGLLDNTLFKIIPVDWLPAWVAQGKSSGLINDWLFDSVVNFDLQKLISLLQINPNGELAKNSLLQVLINVIDRVIGILFGGNAVLPNCREDNNNRNVFEQGTTLTRLETLLGGDGSTLSAVLSALLFRLNQYLNPIATTIFPFFVNTAVKDATYYPSSNAASAVNYLGSGVQITYQDLENYIEQRQTDTNSEVYYGSKYYSTSIKAAQVASDIGDTGFDEETRKTTVDGHDAWRVDFPATYSSLIAAERAVQYVENSSVSSKRGADRKMTYTLRVTQDYRTATSTETVDYVYDSNGNVIDRQYTYSNIHRAVPDSTTVGGQRTYRTGTKGEVVFGEGFRTFGREDYRSNKVYYYNRSLNSLDDAEDFLKDFTSYAESTLPGAYGDWLMYLVKTQLKAANLYDSNDDGVIDENDGSPDMPKSPYPFYKTSGSTNETNYSGTTTYQFSNASSAKSLVVAAALAYADDTEENHDVVLGLNDTEAIVRLALRTIGFDIDGGFSSLSAANLNTIATFCNSIGLTFNAAEGTITRKAFRLIGSNLGSYSTFGNYVNTEDNSSTAISMTPVTTVVLSPENADKVNSDLQKQYVEFAKAIQDYNDGLNNHYDNISWRASICEDMICSAPITNTLQWVLRYTENAYNSGEGRNKKTNEFGLVVSAYTKSTYDNFQRAYEYGNALLARINAGDEITQSLVSVAYKAILQAYKGLEIFTGKADWTALSNYIEQAFEILNGPLGDGADVDRDTGYTMQSLENLRSAAEAADEFKSVNFEAFDTDYQDQVDEQATILYAVINSLKFPEGLEPSAIVSDEYEGTINIDEDTFYAKAGDSRQFCIITGLTEGVPFSMNYIEDGETKDVFIPTGFTVNGGSNYFQEEASSFGHGTGSYIVGSTNFTPRFQYYAVLFGDLNGDTRIDGTDKTIVNMIITQNTVDEQEPYIQAAADVDRDGSVDAQDVQIIENWYQHKDNAVEIIQTESPNSAWFTSVTND